MRELASLKQVLAEMRASGDPAALAGMERFGIRAQNAIGLRAPQIHAIAKRCGKNQALAGQLWDTRIHDARILAGLVGDPATITPEQMDRWAGEFDSWGVCDTCSWYLFDRTPHTWMKIREWAKDDREFVRRAAFATLAGVAVHDKRAPDRLFLKALP